MEGLHRIAGDRSLPVKGGSGWLCVEAKVCFLEVTLMPAEATCCRHRLQSDCARSWQHDLGRRREEEFQRKMQSIMEKPRAPCAQRTTHGQPEGINKGEVMSVEKQHASMSCLSRSGSCPSFDGFAVDRAVAMASRPSNMKVAAAGCCGALVWTIAPHSKSNGFAVMRGAETMADRALPATHTHHSRPAAQGGLRVAVRCCMGCAVSASLCRRPGASGLHFGWWRHGGRSDEALSALRGPPCRRRCFPWAFFGVLPWVSAAFFCSTFGVWSASDRSPADAGHTRLTTGLGPGIRSQTSSGGGMRDVVCLCLHGLARTGTWGCAGLRGTGRR